MTGTVELKKDGILVTYETFGSFEQAAAWGSEYYFTIMDGPIPEPFIPDTEEVLPPETEKETNIPDYLDRTITLPVEQWTFFDDDYYRRSDILEEYNRMKDSLKYYDEDYIYLNLETDPRWYADGRVSTTEDILSFFPEELRGMISYVSFEGVYTDLLDKSKATFVTWTLHLDYEYREYLEQFVIELSKQQSVMAFGADCYTNCARSPEWVRK